MLSQSDYLQGVADYYSALDAKETAVVNLNQAWETYNCKRSFLKNQM